MPHPADSITIKRYGGRRLYNPTAGSYVTLADLAPMLEDDAEFVVREAATGEDITGPILRQIMLKRADHG
jgi:polyhydroxyalkanoate synthesis repressor PhaR